MVSAGAAVHIGGADFFAISPLGSDQPMDAIEQRLLPHAKAALDELVWWSRATMAARPSVDRARWHGALPEAVTDAMGDGRERVSP